jgi:hypothetical protein
VIEVNCNIGNKVALEIAKYIHKGKDFAEGNET